MEERPDSSATPNLVPARPVRHVIRQELVPFLGESQIMAQADDGLVYVAMPGVCTALRLETKAQIRRINRSRVLNEGLQPLELETAGGLQTTNCLRVDLVALWLAGCQTSQMAEPVREKIEAYQRELAPVALRIFMQVLLADAIVPTDPLVQGLRAQIADMHDTIQTLDEHLISYMQQQTLVPAHLERIAGLLEMALHGQQQIQQQQQATDAQVQQLDREQPLTAAHKRAIQLRINEIVRQTRYSASPIQHHQLYAKIKARFNVATYAEIPDGMFEAVMAQLADIQQRATGDEPPDQLSFLP